MSQTQQFHETMLVILMLTIVGSRCCHSGLEHCQIYMIQYMT